MELNKRIVEDCMIGGEPAGMNFTDSDQAHCLLQKLQLQRQKGDLCDVTFLVGGHEFRAHRCVMAAHSPVFDVEFCNEQAPAKLVVSDHSPAIFMAVLEYLYSGTIMVSKTNVTELLKAANHYVIEKLKIHCCEFLEQNTTVSNCFTTKTLAETYHLTQLTKNIEAFILANLSEVIQQNEILAFSDHRLESYLSNKTMPLTEDMKFGLLIKWIEYDFSSRNQKLPALLRHIQWCQMNQMNIYTLIRDSNMFRESQWCMYIVLQLLEDKHMISPMHLSTLEHLKQIFSNYIAMPNTTTSSVPHGGDSKSQSVPPQMSSSHDPHTNTDSYQGKTMHPDNLYESQPPQSHESDDEDDGDTDFIPVPEESPEKGDSYSEEIVDLASLNSIVSIQPVNIAQPPNNSDSCQKVAPIRVKIQKSLLREKRTGKRSKATAKPSRTLEKITNYPVKKYKCSYCNYTAKESKKMQNHEEKVHRSNKQSSFTCCVCEYTTTWNREYYKHMKEHFPGPPFHCDDGNCTWSGERIQQLLNHRMAHRDERPYTCSMCSMKFRTKNNLDAHIKGHRGEKPFKCDECEKTFATKGTLDQHRVTHSAARPYLCDTCGFSTKFQSHLIAHRRIHSGEVYSCQYPNCKYSTPKRSQLACHMRTHLCIRTHICSTCGRGFVEKGHLVRHERIHLEKKPYACESCDYSSTRQDKLKDHVRKYHSPGSTTCTPYKPRKPRKPAEMTYPTLNAEEAKAELEKKMEQAAEMKKIQGVYRKEGEGGQGEQDADGTSTFIIDTSFQSERGMLENQLRGALDIQTPTTLEQSTSDFNTLDGSFIGIL